jgi:hypothetical protein
MEGKKIEKEEEGKREKRKIKNGRKGMDTEYQYVSSVL